MDLPKNFKLTFSKEQIDKSIISLSKQISLWANQSTLDVVGIPVLRGGLFFYADLVRQVDCSIELAPVRSSSYVADVNNIQSEEVKIDTYNKDVKNRNILLIDDICDSGRTFKLLKERLKSLGALDIKTACLIKRELMNPIFNPDYVCFNYPGSEWFVGYGMADKERYSNLDSVYIIKD